MVEYNIPDPSHRHFSEKSQDAISYSAAEARYPQDRTLPANEIIPKIQNTLSDSHTIPSAFLTTAPTAPLQTEAASRDA